MKDDNTIYVLTFHYYDDCAEKDGVFVSRTKKTAIQKAVDTIIAVTDILPENEDAERDRISGILDRDGIYDDGQGTAYVVERTVIAD